MIQPIIHELSNDEYHHAQPYSEYISSSQLKKYLISPKAFKYALDARTNENSDALRIGTLFHDLMACSAEYFDNGTAAISHWLDGISIFTPPINEKTGKPYGTATKIYSESYNAFQQINKGNLVATENEKATILNMHKSLLAECGTTSKQVGKILKWSQASEVSYFWETEDGIKLKVRPDLLTRNKLIDWKTCSLESLDEDSIARQIIKYRYDVSLSMYQYVLHKIENKWYTPILIFIQSRPPFDAVMCDISEWCYQYDPDIDIVSTGIGAIEFKKLLSLHTQCVKTNEWMGAENSIKPELDTRIMKPAIPSWLGSKYFNDDNY